MARSNPIRSSAIFAAGIVFVLLAFATQKADAATESNRAVILAGNICRTPRSGNGSCLPADGVRISLTSGDNGIIAMTTTALDGSLLLRASTNLNPQNRLSFNVDITDLLLTANFFIELATVNVTTSGVPVEFLQ